jgi:thioredoxin reductase (NADPH)
MGSIAPVRRNNNRKASLPEEYDSSKQSNGTVLPLHQRNNASHSSDPSNKYTVRNSAKRKRTRRSSTKPIYCCGLLVDVPMVGVMIIIFVGVVLLVIGGTSFLHGSVVAGGDDASHQTYQKKVHQHHSGKENTDYEPQKRRQHEDFKAGSKRLHHKPSPSFGEGHLAAAEVPGESVLPASRIRVIDGNDQNNNINKKDIYDVVVTGAGPSGLTAALFASRAGLKVHVLGSAATGLLSQTKRLDNFPSFSGENGSTLTGPDWVEATLAQAKSRGATFGPPGLFAKSIERQRMAGDDQGTAYEEENKDVFFALKTSDKTEPEIRAWSVIVATGATPRTLGLRGEDALWGVSLHNCAICDGHLYQETEKKPTTVLVVGGGDAALDAALLLARATKVILVHRRDTFTSAHNLASLDAVRSTPNIEIVTPYVVNEWITMDEDPSQLVGAQLVSPESSPGGGNGNNKRVDIDGAFVMIGAIPNTKWTKNMGIALDEEGLIKTTANLPTKTKSLSSGSMITATSVPGLFAAGEVTDNIYKQAITAAAAGAQSAIDAERWLREQRGVTGTTSSMPGDVKSVGATTADQNKMDPVAVAVSLDDCDLVSEDCIRSIVGAHPVVVFSKPYCPYCRKALEALSLEGLSSESDKLLVIDLSTHSNTQEIQLTLQSMTGRRTVPNVFVDGKSIGGGDETRSFQQSGELATMLAEARALEDHNTDNSSDSSDTESCDLSSEECFLKVVQEYPVLLFSLDWCPECKKSLELLDRIGITEDQIHIIDLDDYEEIALDIRAHMKDLTGRRSVPNLFVGGEFVGGYSQTLELHNTGDLVKKFRAVGAL